MKAAWFRASVATRNANYCVLVNEGVVKVTGLLVLVKVHLASVFGDRAWTEMKMWCVRPMLHTANSHECMGIIGEALQLHSL